MLTKVEEVYELIDAEYSRHAAEGGPEPKNHLEKLYRLLMWRDLEIEFLKSKVRND